MSEPSKRVTISFTNDEAGAKRAMNSDAAYNALFRIGQEIFRPARKHGYPDVEMQRLLTEERVQKPEDADSPFGVGTNAEELVSKLEELFYQIIREEDVDLSDWS